LTQTKITRPNLMSDFLLPVQYLRQVAEQLRVMGLAPEHWLTSCGVISNDS